MTDQDYERCKECRYSISVTEEDCVTGNKDITYFECHRYAPRPIIGAAALQADWPQVDAEDVCGEFENKEN